jgi:predicted metal-dependent HD superfamily phosphohydrolase
LAELGRNRAGHIINTRHSSKPVTPDEGLLLDIDLSILGSDETAFDEYDRSILAEYQWVPEQSYLQAREEVLSFFVDRERLFHTAPFRRRCEESARKNIVRALERLRAG